MIDGIPPLAAFALTALLIELTPGPNMGYLAVLAASRGRLAGLMAVAGVALGLAVAGAAAALGVAGLIAAVPAVYEALRVAGVVYLLFLAYEAWRGEAGTSASIADNGPRAFQRGLLTNLLNPKAYLFYGAVLPRFIDAAQPVVWQTLSLSLVYVLIASAVHLGVVLLAAAAGRFLYDKGKVESARRLAAILLIIVALWLGWTTQR